MHRAHTIRLLFWLVLSLAAAQAQTFTVIHSFTGNQDGAAPYASLTLDSGNLYGTTTEVAWTGHPPPVSPAEAGS